MDNLKTINTDELDLYMGRAPKMTLKVPTKNKKTSKKTQKKLQNNNQTTQKTPSNEDEEAVVPQDIKNTNNETTNFFFTDDITKILLSVYKNHGEKLHNVRYRKKAVWEKMRDLVALQMQSLGHKEFPTAIQCKNRWITVNKAFKAVIDHNNKSGNDRKTCRYFAELEEISGDRPNIRPVAILSSSGSGDQEKDQQIDESEQEHVDDESEQVPTVKETREK